MKTIVTLLICLISGILAPLAAQAPATTSVVTTQMPLKSLRIPVEVTGKDFVTKVYGILSPSLSRDEIVEGTQKALNLKPEEDEYGLWLETADGYGINFYGMSPEVSARAGIGPDKEVTDYGFFFLFPYGSGEREQANSRQAAFSGALLQEFLDMGLAMEVDTLSDALYEVSGDYGTSLVDVRLIEEHETDDDSGRFIIILTVNPDDPDTATASN